MHMHMKPEFDDEDDYADWEAERTREAEPLGGCRMLLLVMALTFALGVFVWWLRSL